MTSTRLAFPSAQRFFMCLTALLLVMPVFLIPATAHESAPRSLLPSASVGSLGSFLPGLGTADPPRPNLSTDHDFSVYEWNVPFTNGGKVYQVNSKLTGKVSAVVTVLPKGTHVVFYPSLGGMLSGTSMSPVPATSSSPPAGCPCTHKTIPLPGGGETIIVRGADGDVISVVAVCPSGESCKEAE